MIRRLNSIKYFRNGDIGTVTLLSHFFLPFGIRRVKANREIITARAKHFGIYSDDIFLISYPHSGRTWLSRLLTNLKKPGSNWSERNYIVPDYASDNLMKSAKHIPRPRIFACHNEQLFESYYSKAIYLYRDGRDVAVSLYKTLRRNGFKHDFGKFIETYVQDGFNGSPAWHNHIENHLFKKTPKAVLAVKYEDLCREPTKQIKRICLFAKLPFTDNNIKNALEYSSFQNYQKFTNNLGAKGGPGAWEAFFDNRLHSFYLKSAGQTLSKLGYLK